MNEREYTACRSSNDTADAPQNSAIDWAQREGTVDQVLDALRGLSLARRKRRRRSGGALCVMAGAFGLAFLAFRVVDTSVFRREETLAPNEASGAAFIAGEQGGSLLEPEGAEYLAVSGPKQEHLPDGSLVTLRDGAEFVLEFSSGSRRVVLRRGTAYFVVAKDPLRPFEVVANGLSICALGTAFCVDLMQEAIEVIVTEGRISVEERLSLENEEASGFDASKMDSSDLLGLTLNAGERVVAVDDLSDAQVEPIAVKDWEEKLSWRVPRLEFSRVRLGELLPEFNRYSTLRIVLAEPELASLRISGVLRADRGATLLEMLRINFDLRVEERGEAEVVVYRR